MNKTYQRAQAIKYLKRGFEVANHDDRTDDDDFKELSSNDLFLASISNSLVYVGDQIGELYDILHEYHKNEILDVALTD
jgi:hypothetical protein